MTKVVPRRSEMVEVFDKFCKMVLFILFVSFAPLAQKRCSPGVPVLANTGIYNRMRPGRSGCLEVGVPDRVVFRL